MSEGAERKAIRSRLRDAGWTVVADYDGRDGTAAIYETFSRAEAVGFWKRSTLTIRWSGYASEPELTAAIPLPVAPERLREIAECFAVKES